MPPDFGFFTLPGILTFLLVMTVLVAAHELGHFVFARLFKMDVEEFAIGFGKKPLWTWMRRGGTEFNIRPWPLGGFVKIRGMIPEEDGSEVAVENGFYSKGPVARFFVLLAGPAFSFLAGWVLFLLLYSVFGSANVNRDAVLGGVTEKGPAAAAGLKVGDRVVSVNGQSVDSFYEMVTKVRDNGETPIAFVIQREGETLNFNVTPKLDPTPTPVMNEKFEPTGELRKQWKIQAGPGFERVYGFAAAIKQSNDSFIGVLMYLPRIVSSFQTFRDNVGGPIAMGDGFSRAQRAGIEMILFMAAALSVSLGIFNLLPISPLDGGQMAVAVVEMFRRGKRLSFQMQNVIATVGFAMIGVFVLFVFANDISRLLR
jgi:regulator of sigma E protease